MCSSISKTFHKTRRVQCSVQTRQKLKVTYKFHISKSHLQQGASPIVFLLKKKTGIHVKRLTTNQVPLCILSHIQIILVIRTSVDIYWQFHKNQHTILLHCTYFSTEFVKTCGFFAAGRLSMVNLLKYIKFPQKNHGNIISLKHCSKQVV